MSSDSLTTRGFVYLRRRAFDWVAEVGRIAMLVGDTFRSLGHGLRSFNLLVDEMHAIGVQSLLLVLIVSLFTGAVAARQPAMGRLDAQSATAG